MHSTEQRVMALEGALACHSVLYLVGCAGIGKSWLVNEWLKGAPYSHWPVRAGGGVAAALAQFLSGESAGQATAQAVQAVAQVIRRAAPTLLVIDHLHEASADELAFWAQVRGQLQSARGVRIVALSRRHLPLTWPVHDILPLTFRETAELAALHLGHAPPAGFTQWLWEWGRGHPLLTRELIQHAERSGILTRRGHWAQWCAPARLVLPPSMSAILRTWTAPESEFSEAFLEALSTEAFGHPLLRLLVWQHWPAPAVEGVVRRALRLCRQGQPPESFLADLATEHARLTLDAEERFHLLLAGARAARSPAQVAALWQELARHCQHHAATQNGNALPFPADGHLAWALALRHDQPLQAAQHLATFTQVKGEPLTQEEWQLRLSVLADTGVGGELPLDVPPASRAALARWWRAEQARAAGKVRDAQRVLDLLNDDPAEYEADLLNVLGLALHDLGRLEEAQATLNAALGRACTPAQRGRSRQLLGLLPLYAGRDDEARACFEAALEDVAGSPDAEDVWVVRADNQILCGMLAERSGDLKRACSLYAEAAQAYLNAGLTGRFVVALGYLSGAQLEQGQFAQAHETVQQAWLVRHEVRGLGLVPLLSHAVLLYFGWDDERACDYLRDTLEELQHFFRVHTDVQCELKLALAWAATGQVGLAQRRLPELLEAAAASPLVLSEALWVRSFCFWREGNSAAARQDIARAQAECTTEKAHLVYRGWEAIYCDTPAVLEQIVHELNHRQLGGYATELRRWAADPPGSRKGRHRPRQEPAGIQLGVLGNVILGAPQPTSTATLPRQAGLLLAQLHAAQLLRQEALSCDLLAETLFPSAASPPQRLSRLLTGVRQVYGPGVLVKQGDLLRLGACESDATLFLHTGRLALWRGLPFTGLPDTAEVMGAAAMLLDELLSAAQAALAVTPEEVIRVAAILRQADPYADAPAQLVLRAHWEAGHTERRIQRVYTEIKREFAEVQAILPDDWQNWLGEPNTSCHLHRSTRWRQLTGRTQSPQQPGRPSRLNATQLSHLRQAMQRPPDRASLTAQKWTLGLATQFIRREYGVELSVSQLSRLLRKDP